MGRSEFQSIWQQFLTRTNERGGCEINLGIPKGESLMHDEDSDFGR